MERLESILTFKTTVYDDDGTYRCFAENKIDSVHTDSEENNLLICMIVIFFGIVILS